MKKKPLSFFVLCTFGGLLILKPSLVGMIEYLKKTNRPVLQKHEEHAQEVKVYEEYQELLKDLRTLEAEIAQIEKEIQQKKEIKQKEEGAPWGFYKVLKNLGFGAYDRAQEISELKKKLNDLIERRDEMSKQLVDLDPTVQRLVPAKECKLSKEFTDFLSTDVQKMVLSHDNWVYSVAFSPDGSKLATGSDDKKARVWDVNSGHMLYELPHDKLVRSVAFSPDGSKLATGSDDKKARVWDANSGKMLYELPHYEWVFSVAFSPDGGKLATATGSRDKKARVWDVNSRNMLYALPHYEWVFSVAFSPDGSKLATGFFRKARVWDANSGNMLYELPHYNLVESVAFSPDGSTLATGCNDGRARIWDVKYGAQLFKLLASPSRAQCDLLQMFDLLMQDTQKAVKEKKALPGRIQATRAQWYTFQTFPAGVQKTLQKYIVAPEKEKDFYDPDKDWERMQKEKGKEKE